MFRREKIPQIEITSGARARWREMARKIIGKSTPLLVFAVMAFATYIIHGGAARNTAKLEGARTLFAEAQDESVKQAMLGALLADLGRIETRLDADIARRAMAGDPIIGKIDYDTLERLRYAFFDGAPRRTHLREQARAMGLDKSPGIRGLLSGFEYPPRNTANADALAGAAAAELATPEAFLTCAGAKNFDACLAASLEETKQRIQTEFRQ